MGFMTPERWQQIERLVQEVLERDPDLRSAFLDQRCDGDPDLRAEVESLASVAQSAQDFLSNDALQDGAEVLEEAHDESLEGLKVGHYIIKKHIGAGGMGEVYLAEDIDLGRPVALKLLDPTLTNNSSLHARFTREARLAASLDHPNICTIHEVSETQGRPFIAMQYVEGQTLKELIDRKPLRLERLLSLALQVADALAGAHSHGIIHRDIKSQNIMVTPTGQVKVLDFGLAKSLDPNATHELDLTFTGEVRGTPSFMSPEQARGEQMDQRTDIFSFGVVLYEMATGRTPFAGKNRADLISGILKDKQKPARDLNDEIPPKLSSIIDRALAKDPESRYQDMPSMIIDLKAAQDVTPPTAFQQLGIPQLIRNHAALIVLFVIGLSLGLVAVRVTFSRRHQQASLAPIKSIAVLPFKPLVSENRDESLEMGMADSLISRLTNIKEIDVRPLTAVRRYVAVDQDPLAAGREQSVDAVLDGNIQKAGDRIRVTVRLVRVDSGTTLWTDTFDDTFTDIFTVEDSISERVAGTLTAKLTGEEKALVAQHSTNNPEAYELNLKGRYLRSKRTGESIKKSIDYFNEAIAKDPNYALAYAGLANSYQLLSNYNVTTPEEAYSKAKLAAAEALKRDDRLAEAHLALAEIKRGYDWDFAGAEQEYKRALELNPNYAAAHSSYGEYLGQMGRSNEAIAQMKRAKEIEPLSLTINTDLGSLLYFAGRVDESIEQLRETLELDSSWVRTHIELGYAFRQKRQYQEAIKAFKNALEIDRNESYALSQLAHTYGLIGQNDEAYKIIEQLHRQAKQQYVLPTDIAAAYVGVGDKTRAFEWLEKGFRDRDDGIPFLKVDPSWDPIRSDARFQSLLQRIGLT